MRKLWCVVSSRRTGERGDSRPCWVSAVVAVDACLQARQSSCGLCSVDTFLGPFTLCSHLPPSPSCLSCLLTSLLPPVERLTLWVCISLSGSFKSPLWLAQPWWSWPFRSSMRQTLSIKCCCLTTSSFSTKMVFSLKNFNIICNTW